MAKDLVRGLAEQRAHSRADVADAIFRIDLPQPAHAALLIFLKKKARAFALTADVGVGLELVERPAGDGQDAEDRYSKGEDDRQHVLEWNRVTPKKERPRDPGRERDH